MTNLIERFTVTVEVNHDRFPETSTAYGGFYSPAMAIDTYWNEMRDWFGKRGSGFHAFGNGVTLYWSHTGLEEAPEESGGDN